MTDDAPAVYILGHSDHELRRLGHQAGVIDPVTRGFFVSAGIGRGMRVLDVSNTQVGAWSLRPE